jgi:hypothetical protein
MRTLAIATTVVLALAPFAGGEGKELGPDNPVAAFLEDGVLGPGVEYRVLALFPILLDGPERPFPALTAEEAFRRDELGLSEKGKVASIQGLGFGLETILVLQGEILEGGRVDRMAVRDAVVRPHTEVPIPTVPAERPGKREALPSFKARGFLAPPYLRMAALLGDYPTWLAKFLEYHGTSLAPGVAPSVANVIRTGRMQFLVSDYVLELERLPLQNGGRAVGIVALVGGKAIVWETFGSRSRFRTHWPRLLESIAFAAVEHELRTGVAGKPVLKPAAGGVSRLLPHVREFRASIVGAKVTARPKGELAGAFRVSSGSVLGEASAGPAGFLHMAVFSRVRSLEDLYRGKLPPAPLDEDAELDPGVLERKAERGTLTEYERRYLERIRRIRDGMRPGGAPNRPQPPQPPAPGRQDPQPRPPDPAPGGRNSPGVTPPPAPGGSGGGGSLPGRDDNLPGRR